MCGGGGGNSSTKSIFKKIIVNIFQISSGGIKVNPLDVPQDHHTLTKQTHLLTINKQKADPLNPRVICIENNNNSLFFLKSCSKAED